MNEGFVARSWTAYMMKLDLDDLICQSLLHVSDLDVHRHPGLIHTCQPQFRATLSMKCSGVLV